ncbi:MAG: DUF3828 domain-containing protein [Flavobacteriales bacterium]
MKHIRLYIALIVLLIGCKQKGQSISKNENPITETKFDTTIDKREAIEFLTDFYTKYYGEYRDRKGMEDYVSVRILNRIDSLSKEDNLVLDYDPFIQGQDWDTKILIKSLKIKPLKSQNEYRVSFLRFGRKDERKQNVDFSLVNNEKRNILINNILSDDYLNFNIKKNNENFKNEEKKSFQNDKQRFNVNATWSIACPANLTLFDINDNEGYLSLYSFNKIYINTILKETDTPNKYDVFFKNTEFKQKFYDIYEYIENDEDISKTKPIGEINIESNNKMIFRWIGLYNIKKQKLEFVGDDFLLIKEGGGKNPVLLEKCD